MIALALLTFAAAGRMLCRGCSSAVAVVALVLSIALSAAAVAEDPRGIEPLDFGAMAQRCTAATVVPLDLSRMACRQTAVSAAPIPELDLTAMAKRPILKPTETVAARKTAKSAQRDAEPIEFTLYAPDWCTACPPYLNPATFPVEKGFRMTVVKKVPPYPVRFVPAFGMNDKPVAEAPITWQALKPKLLAAHRNQNQHVSSR